MSLQPGSYPHLFWFIINQRQLKDWSYNYFVKFLCKSAFQLSFSKQKLFNTLHLQLLIYILIAHSLVAEPHFKRSELPL